MDLNISNVRDVYVSFNGYYIRGAVTLWVSREKPARTKYSDGGEWTPTAIQETFSYGVPNGKCLPVGRFDFMRSKKLSADRYGGYGIGPNGGGARTGIVGDFQVKGVGRTPLVGSGTDDWHSYGGQSLIDAVLEAINSEVFGHILPVGTVKCYAVICTGSDTAYMPTGDWGSERGPGALLVREMCARPAHFLRAPNFREQEEHKATLLNDVERTRRVNVQLHSIIGSHKDVVRFLGTFLSNCAKQFAFARVFRIYHGVLSPSNISFDGRWLDLTNISFVDAGINYQEGADLTSFYDEVEVPLRIIDEFVYTYTKYNATEFNIKTLVEYYRAGVESCMAHYLVRLFGIDSLLVSDVEMAAEYPVLIGRFSSLFSREAQPVVAAPTGFFDGDPVTILLEKLFSSLFEEVAGEDEFRKEFYRLVSCAFRRDRTAASYAGFLSRAAIHSLKRAYFCSFFNRGRILGQLLEKVGFQGASFADEYIESHLAVAKWLFEDESGELVVLFSSPKLKVTYGSRNRCFNVKVGVSVAEEFNSVAEFRCWIECQDPVLLSIHGYDFMPGLLRIIGILEGLSGVVDFEVCSNARVVNYV